MTRAGAGAGGGADDVDPAAVRDVARLVARASSLLVITGAGVSAESGLPTYRGIGGLYERDLTAEGIPIEVALSGTMFQRRPELTWRYLAELERACRDAAPSAAHRAIAELERRVARTWLVTQNVDGLHLAAGSRQVIEIHGNIHRWRCPTCGLRAPVVGAWAAESPQAEVGVGARGAHGAPPDDGRACWDPPCPRCGGALRTDVVLFEEALPRDALAALERELARGFDLVMVIGTTALFPYIAGPVIEAAREGVPTIEINPDTTELSHFVAHRFAARAGPTLAAILAALG